VSISEQGTSPEEFTKIHEDAIEKINFQFIVPGNSIIDRIPSCKSASDFSYPKNLEKSLVDSLYIADYKQYIEVLHEIISIIVEYHYLYAQSLLLRVTSAISWAAARIHQATPLIDNDATIVNLPYKILKCRTLEEAEWLLENAGNTIIMLIHENKNQKNKCLIRKVDDFIINNYKDINLSATLISEHLGFSTTYLNRIYRANKNNSITNQINKFRLEQAASLLIETNLDMKTIAETVGLVHSGYFYTLFKKFYEMTPKDYRSFIRKQNHIVPMMSDKPRS
jgi:YesN/AraC family two-component response regulator